MHILKQWRLDNDLTAEAAGRLIGTTRQGWSRFENGTRKVSHLKVLEIERVTNISRHDLRPDIFGKRPGEAANEQPKPLVGLAS